MPILQELSWPGSKRPRPALIVDFGVGPKVPPHFLVDFSSGGSHHLKSVIIGGARGPLLLHLTKAKCSKAFADLI